MNFENLVREDRIDLPENLPTVKSVVEAQEVGMWDGAASAMADILPNVALNIGSTVTTGYFGSVGRAQIEAAAVEAKELGVPIDDPKRFAQDQETRARENAKEWRRLAREEYTPDPNATGIVAQVIHGVGTELGKAAAATVASLGNPAMAATVYGGMHGVETYNRLRDEGVDEDTALDAGVGAFAAGTLGMAIPGSLGATRLRSAIYGATVNPISNIAEDTTIKTILDNADYSKLAGAIDPFDPLNLAIASVVGGGFGAMGWRAPDRIPRTDGTPDVAPEPAARSTGAAADTPSVRSDATARLEARVDAEQRPAARTETSAPAEDARPSVASVEVEEVRRASSMRQSEGGVMLQNRNRGTFSSIAQMNKIAASPDYDRVSVSRDFAQGAPVVAFVHDIPDTQIGRVERVTASDGSKMSMRYAVMEADTILTSNRVDGTRVEDYGTSDYHVTIAGNGRVAGITEAYRRGTANKYKADMVSDAEAVGIDPKIIEGMRQPVLVRLMTDRDASRADIAQLSNETGTKGFDATEQAENDAASIDVAALAFDEEGNITPEAVAQFVALLPDNSGVIDRGGVPNNMARPRLERAIFQRVYGRPYLTSLLTDTEGGGRIVSVLMRVAPKMLQLEESGDLDFRNDLVAAAIEIYEARAGGARMSLRELADQRPLGRTPETQAFLDYFAANPTKVNEPVRIFNELADWATANRYDPTSMFVDESPVATRVDLMAEFADLAGVDVDPTVLAQIGATVSREQAIEKVRTKISEQLAETGMDAEQVEAQATLWTGAVMRLAAQNGVEPLDILPKIKLSDGVGGADSFGQIIGIQGATNLRNVGADIPYLDVAETMEAQGKSAAEIRLATGWERGADGNWRYEIPDFRLKDGWSEEWVEDAGNVLRKDLSDVVDAPELFSAYPQLAQLNVELGRLSGDTAGYFAVGSNTIRLPRTATTSPDATLSTLIHEVQHAIQSIEGFATGASPNVMEPKDLLLWRDMGRLRELRRSEAWQEYDRQVKGLDPWEASEEELRALDELGNHPDVRSVLSEVERLRETWGYSEPISRAINSDDWEPFGAVGQEINASDPNFQTDRYFRVAGEVEARNAQSRREMKPKDRRAITLEETESIPRDRQIVKVYRGQNLSVGDQVEFARTLREWTSEETLSRARGKSREQIFEEFDNTLTPIAFIPEDFLPYIFVNELSDNRVYSSQAYFVDHAVNNHGQDILPSDYFRIQEILSEPDEVILDRRKGEDKAIFTKQYGRNFLVVVKIEQGADGHLQMYKTLHKTRKKKPYPTLDRAPLPVYAHRSKADVSQFVRIEEPRYTPGGDNFSGRDSQGDIVAQRVEDVNGRELRGAFSPSENRITLTPNANITTFSHEMGHWWLSNAVELSKRADVNPELRRDVRKLFDLWGVKDQADWDALGVEGQRRFHEQFASWVEEYLVTGRPPSPSLQGLFEKFRRWILDLYRDFRAHLNERYRSEFGEDLPELSDEVRDILERNLIYEDARETALREFNPTATAQDAARYAAYQRTVREDQPVDMSDARELQESLFTEADAKFALDTGEKISIQAPIDVDRANGEVQRLRENLNMPESLELRAPDEGMPVHEIPTRTREEIEAARAEETVGAAQEKIAQGFQELIGLPVEGEGAEAQSHTSVSSEDARIQSRAKSILEESPDMAVLPDGDKDVRSAADVMAEVERDAAEDDKWANLLETTAVECILKNRGI